MENVILVLDIGTQSTRASIVNDKGEIKIIKVEKYATPYLTPKNGYVEQHPDFYYDAICKCTKAIAEEAPELMNQVKSMVIAAFRDTACFLDENMNIVRNSVLWLDQRSAKLTKKLAWYENLMFALVGMTNTIVFNRKSEVDGFAYHNSEKQQERDLVKNTILEKYNIPILRFSTIGSSEESKLISALNKIN